MRGTVIVGLLVATAATAQTLPMFDDSVENGFFFSESNASLAPADSSTSLCHSGTTCAVVTFIQDYGYVDLSQPGFDLLASDGALEIWVRAQEGTAPVTLQLSFHGAGVGSSFTYSVGTDYTLLFLGTSGFGTPIADGVRFSGSSADGGALIIDDIALITPDDGGTGGGQGGGGGRDGFGGGSFGFGGGGDTISPPAGGGGGYNPCDFCNSIDCGCGTGGGQGGFGYGGGSGQFGGGADLGCNCDSTTPMSNIMTGFFGLMVSMQLRRRRR